MDEFLARYSDEEQYHWLIPKNQVLWFYWSGVWRRSVDGAANVSFAWQLLSFMEAHHNGDTLIAFMEMVREHHSRSSPFYRFRLTLLSLLRSVLRYH